MTIVYLDCFSGVSGDMLLAAFLDAGLPEEYLRRQLAKLPLTGYDLSVETMRERSIAARRFMVTSANAQPLRHLHDLTAIVARADFSQALRERAIAIFTALAEAEAAAHGVSRDEIHFHEVGAVDTVVDVVGALIALDYFAVERLVVSPLPVGRGFVDCAHGRLPLPAPAVCELLRGLPVYGVSSEHELITPTGAALIKVLADDFGLMPSMFLESVGYGAGARRSASGQSPNLLRLSLGKARDAAALDTPERVRILTTHLDDWQSETFPYLCEKLFAAGALDVALAPVLMKKGRPGQALTVICRAETSTALEQIIFRETTAIGLRYRDEARRVLLRERVTVVTPFGELIAKKVELPDGCRLYPEYEECRKLAEKTGESIIEIYRAALLGGER
ncbi:MAG: nickel pincer cofactor biosynthesis protein LarC [Desulfobulbaceae bacterium]|jgi:uncharacterized protein (TIGR00299 family) protein|nr:nickel pincer cofactor biosynthesis protein LarC [Desulfobulbaceae bacterium]